MNSRNFLSSFLILTLASPTTPAGVYKPDLHWSFDETCSSGGEICILPTTPAEEEGYRLSSVGSVGYDQSVEGVVGLALRLKVSIDSEGIFRQADRCFTSITNCEGGLTIAFWLKVYSSTSNYGEVLSTGSSSAGALTSSGVLIVLNNVDALEINVRTEYLLNTLVPNGNFSYGEWVYITMVWTPITLSFYMNGTHMSGLETKTDDPDPGIHNILHLGQRDKDITIDELKVWFTDFNLSSISEIFRIAFSAVEKPTTPQATTLQEPVTTAGTTPTTKVTPVTTVRTTPTTIVTTATLTTARTTPTTTVTTEQTTPKPMYAAQPHKDLRNISEDLYNNEIENRKRDYKTTEEIEERTEETVHTVTQLSESIRSQNLVLETELALSYISGLSASTSAIVAEENAETWESVTESTRLLNEIIESADTATETVIDSLPPQNITTLEVVKKETFSMALVPMNHVISISITPTQNVEVELSSKDVAELSKNKPVVLAANVFEGANICYNQIPATEVDIVEGNTIIDSEPFDLTTDLEIVSDIVSVNLRPELVPGGVVTLTFKHTKVLDEKKNYTVFGAYINKTTEKWTNQYCKVLATNVSYTTIEATHLTNFAILMQVVDVPISEKHLQNLSLITYIGSTISIFCLVLSLCVFALVKSGPGDPSSNVRGHRTERYHIHANLALAILLGQVTFLVGANNQPGTDACKSTAILLHFFYMSAFSWMLVEGLHLYNLVVKVFRSASSRLGYYYITGWGSSLLICVISVAAAFSGYGETNNCWLDMNNTRVIWAFVGPALFVILVNIFILIKVTRIITNLAKSQENCINCMTDRATVVVCAKAIAVLLPILGVTWVFGVFAVNEDTIVFQYIFAVCNSLQGFFLFMFHCVFNSETRSSLLYRTKSLRSDINSKSFSNSKSRRPTKVELVKNDEVSDGGGPVDTASTAFNTNNNRTQITPYGTPMSSRESSSASRYSPKKPRRGFKQLESENPGTPKMRPTSANSGRLSANSRRIKPGCGNAW